jgi:hypothetical protein
MMKTNKIILFLLVFLVMLVVCMTLFYPIPATTCGYAMQYTRSLIAPVLIHAGADLMIIVPVFAAYGVTG